MFYHINSLAQNLGIQRSKIIALFYLKIWLKITFHIERNTFSKKSENSKSVPKPKLKCPKSTSLNIYLSFSFPSSNTTYSP
jgi:hypothetical protein